jgi:epoxyqueuosine reductase QueG
MNDKRGKMLTLQLKRFARREGADIVGIAPVERLPEYGAPEGYRPQDILPGAKALVVFGMAAIPTPRLLRTVRDDDDPIGMPLGSFEHSINFVLLGSGWPGATQCDLLAYRVARFVMKRHHNAIPIPAGHPYVKKDYDTARGIIAHKYAAMEAGLGELGRNNLLLTPQFGCHMLLSSTLTDAPLEPDQRFQPHLCDGMLERCKMACVAICPVGALTGDRPGKLTHWQGKSRTLRGSLCGKMQYSVSGKAGYPEAHGMIHQHILRCGMCLAACPVGRQKSQEDMWANTSVKASCNGTTNPQKP